MNGHHQKLTQTLDAPISPWQHGEGLGKSALRYQGRPNRLDITLGKRPYACYG